MVKFSIFFKDTLLQSATFEAGVVHIGRDESNDITIDSLTFAPAHIAVILKDSEHLIKQLNADFPLVINGERHSKYSLQDGDIISIGKHRIIYNLDNTSANTSPANNNKLKTDQQANPPNRASLTILDGKHAGRIVPLNKSMTRIGHDSAGIMIISRRKDGFFASILEPNDKIKINDNKLSDKSVQLQNNDTILHNDITMQFLWKQ